jgi:putative ABC transport system permease protein
VFASINYVNLATARAAERASEVGIRKVLGSSRRALWIQFLGESLILSRGSGLIAIALSWSLLPLFYRMTGIDLETQQFLAPVNIASIILLSLCIGIVAGIFPAFYLSSQREISVLKGKFAAGRGGEHLRRTLVSTQYFIAALLVSVVIFVYRQTAFIKNKDIGFDRANLVHVKVPSDSAVNNHIDVFMEEIKASPHVLATSLGRVELHKEINSFTPTLQNEDGTTFQVGSDNMFVDADFITAIGGEITIGRNFDRRITNEAESSILINEAAVRKFGWDRNPLGGKFAGFTPREPAMLNVIGVVKDFHLGVSYQLVHPTIIFLSQGAESDLYVRINGDALSTTLEMMSRTWKKRFPDYNMEYSFVDQNLASLYARDENFLTLLGGFCVVILFIASVGIIGLISYTTQTRRKEIAIRKVLGSSIRGIITVLSQKFVMLIVIANLVAMPATFFVINIWLESFAYRVELVYWPFIVPLLVCIVFTAMAVIYHTARAAVANPVDALKYE